jgi:phospholipid/cholesterol/gamma-HCH transport system substrate-binding protein
MSTGKNKRTVIVGLFVFIGLILLVAIVLILGGQRKTFAKSFTLHAVFDDVSGLQQGNNIWLAGVKVGTVKKISFDPNAKVVVTMNVLSSVHEYIHQDAKAKISSDGLIGNKIIVLYGGSPQLPLIASGGTVGIKTALSTEDLMTTLQENNKNLLAITTDFKTVSQRLAAGQGTIGKLLNDETMANTLQSSLNTLQATAANARQFTSNLSGFTAKLQAPGSMANDLVTDTVIFNRLRNTAAHLQEVSQMAGGIVNQLEQASSGINKSLKSTTSPVGVLLNDQQVAADLKGTLSNLQSGTQKLDEDLEALQHNFLLRGFFKKKEKEKKKLEANEVKIKQ